MFVRLGFVFVHLQEEELGSFAWRVVSVLEDGGWPDPLWLRQRPQSVATPLVQMSQGVGYQSLSLWAQKPPCNVLHLMVCCHRRRPWHPLAKPSGCNYIACLVWWWKR